MVLHGKHIALGCLALAAWVGVALAAGVSVQPNSGYTRLMFAFDAPARLELAGSGTDITLTFDRPVQASMDAVEPKLAAVADSITQSADGKKITLKLKKNYRVRQFVSGNAVGIDIMNSVAPPAAPKPEPAPEPTPEPKPEPVKVLKPVPPKPEPKPKPKADEPPPAEAAAEEPKVIRVVPPSILTTKDEPPPAPVAETVAEEEVPPAPHVNPAEALGPIAEPPLLTTKEPEPEPAAPGPAPEPSVQAQAAPVTAVEEKPAAPGEEPIVVDRNAPFLVGVKPGKDGTEINFPWTERVAAAVFERGNELWLVFSKEADANPALLRSVLPKAVIRLDQFAYEGATVLRLSTDGTLHARVSQPKKSYSWNVILSPEIGRAKLDVPVSGEKDENEKSYLQLGAFDTAEPMRFFDPTVGDLLVVIPTYEFGRGVANPKTMPELSVLATPQGIAIASLREDLTTARDRTGVSLIGKKALAVSENLPVLNAEQAPVPGVSSASTVMIPYDQWYVPAAEFMDTRAERLRTWQEAKEAAKPDALMALAKLYLGQAMMGEGLGYLQLIQQRYPDYYTENKLALLSAASYLLSGRPAEAQAAIDSPELASLPEAELWREAISLVAPEPSVGLMTGQSEEEKPQAAEQAATTPPEAVEEEEEEEEVGEVPASEGDELEGDEETPPPVAAEGPPDPTVKPTEALGPTGTTEEATATEERGEVAPATPAAPAPPPMKREFNYLDYNKDFIRFYPPRIRQKLAIMAADYYLKSGQPEKSVATFDTLNRDGILGPVQPYAEFMLGSIAAAKDKPKEALAMWDRMAAQQEDPYVRARARFAGLMLRYEKGMITTPEVTEALERLRMSWRGDGLEREILTTLIKIYREEKQYDATLRTMKYLLQGFPGEVDTLTLAGDMTELFEELFLHGLADDMPPLKSLGLFYEFRELTPIGTRGDEIIQKLADRLASVDLLDRATQLLEHQIRFRVSGETRARVGARLSVLYLLNKQPKRALEVLEITNYGNMPAPLKRQRLQLTAQALAENGRPDEALSMLYNDPSPEGALLKLDILWSMQDWPNVINVGEDILASRQNLTEPLSVRETPVLLKLALAYSFEDDPTQLKYLRDYYMELVPEGAYKEIFDYLTNDTAPLDPDDFALVAQQISRTESFMSSFKSKIAAGRLSDVAN